MQEPPFPKDARLWQKIVTASKTIDEDEE